MAGLFVRSFQRPCVRWEIVNYFGRCREALSGPERVFSARPGVTHCMAICCTP